MRPRDLFGLGVRLIGVWIWTEAAYWAYFAAMKGAGTGIGSASVPVHDDLANAILYALVGTALFVGAPFLVWLAYGYAPRHQADDRTANDLSTDG